MKSAAALAAVALCSCNTVRGFGEDVNALGRTLTNASETSASR
ncbi:MAG: entericidin A/B family lipoprotein [Chthoniobacterales bacterium]|nr:entericidin A/B family lipoprotein [Chthoniobacterales bacterium]